MGSGAKPQPTNDLVHSQGQNNSSRSNIFVGFAGEKIKHFAKLKQKDAKDTLEREKQVCLEKCNNKKAQQRKCQKTSSSKRIQMFYRMMLMISKTPLPVCIVKFSTVSPLLSGLNVKYVSNGLAGSVLIWERRECSFATAVNKCSFRHHLDITACLGLI